MAIVRQEIVSAMEKKNVVAELRKALPNALSAERFARISLTTFQKNPLLMLCTKESLFACMVESAQLGLEPDPSLGLIYFVPFKDQATIIVGYKGFAQLAYNSGAIFDISGAVVRKGEKFSEILGTEMRLIHVPKDHGDEKGSDATWERAYAVARFTADPKRLSTFKSLERAEIFRRRAKSYSYTNDKKGTPWFTNPESMWIKTAIRALSTLLPKSTTDKRFQKLQRALTVDALAEVEGGLIPTDSGFEPNPDKLIDVGDESSLPPIQESKELKKGTKGKKIQVPPGGNPAVPKASIPKEGEVLPPLPKKEKPKDDPQISGAQLTAVYAAGTDSNSWTVESIREWVTRKYKCKVAELRVSQLAEVLNVMRNGE